MRLFGLDGHMLRSVAALCLPTVCVAAFVMYFLVVDVPKIVRDEKIRVAEKVEKTAQALRDDPAQADFTWVRGVGVVSGDFSMTNSFPATLSWKGWSPKGGTRNRGVWGWRKTEKGLLAWVRGTGERQNTVYARHADIEERDYALVFYLFGPSFLFVLVGTTCLGAKYFLDYVRSRDDFLAATAHDLTTPLVGMRHMIGQSDADAKLLNERMIRLVENIKDFLRLRGRRPKARREPFDILKAYGEAYALFRDDYRDLLGGRDVPVEAGRLPLALGDDTITVQIIWNLLGNDLKYAAPHGRVRVRFAAEGEFVNAEFIDEGHGISPRDMRRVFDRYYRAKTVLQSGKGGFGIGLCTARELAKDMGGELSLRANRPRGCVFTLKLPASPAAARQ